MNYRVWPDGTTQECSEAAYEWMSDDYLVVSADSDEEALSLALGDQA